MVIHEGKMRHKVPLMLPIKEVSARTGLSYHFIRQLCIESKIIYLKTGNKYLINFDRFIDFLNGDEVQE